MSKGRPEENPFDQVRRLAQAEHPIARLLGRAEGMIIGSSMKLDRKTSIEVGEASATRLRQPVNTRFGTFSTRYDYLEGCVPLTELNRGINVIQFSLSRYQSPGLVFQIGKAPEGDVYNMLAFQSDGADTMGFLGEDRISSAELEGSLEIDEELTGEMLAAYKIDTVHGFTNEPERDVIIKRIEI